MLRSPERGVKRRPTALRDVKAPYRLGAPSTLPQDLALPLHDRRVPGQSGRIEVARGRLLDLEMVVLVHAAHQGGAVPCSGDLLDPRRDVADGVADAAGGGAVGWRAVEHAHVMQRHLPRMQHDVHAPGLVHLEPRAMAARAAAHVVKH